MKAKRIAGYALLALPVALSFALDVSDHGFALALLKLVILVSVCFAIALGFKWAIE